MRLVYKYPIVPPGIPRHVEAPADARVVLVAMQDRRPTVWLEVDTEAPAVLRRFAVFGTGEPLPPGVAHVGSCVDAPFIWHVYELP